MATMASTLPSSDSRVQTLKQSGKFILSQGAGSKTCPLWRTNELKSHKEGNRRTIYWVGKALSGEDGKPTGARAPGASFHGEWSGDKKSGYGVQTYPNGNKYEGQWEAGLRSGEGVLWVPIGKTADKLRKLYVGSWKNDRRHGRGTCYFAKGEYFQGDWEQGKMHGQGRMRYSNGDLYLGGWHNGLRSGQGTLNRANGDCYEGFWLNDMREGSGTYFYAQSGKVFVGEWSNDLPRAGVYTQAQPNPEQASQVPKTSSLPPVRIAQPVDVLESALARVREARKGYRAKNTPIGRLFAEDELVSLRDAFDGASLDGGLTFDATQALCGELGLEVSAARVEGAFRQCEFASDVALRFDDFARVIAVILDDEAMEASLSVDLMKGGDSLEGWEEVSEALPGSQSQVF